MIDPGAQALTASGVRRSGVSVAFQRRTGFAPNVVVVAANVIAIIQTVQADSSAPDEGSMPASKTGSIKEDQRFVIVMAADLTNAGFPLPLRANDKIVVTDTGELLNIDRIDAYKRAMAGAIEIYASGVT